MDRVMITIRVGYFNKPKVVWRNVNKDKKGYFVMIDRVKRYLSDMKKESEINYSLHIY